MATALPPCPSSPSPQITPSSPPVHTTVHMYDDIFLELTIKGDWSTVSVSLYIINCMYVCIQFIGLLTVHALIKYYWRRL